MNPVLAKAETDRGRLAHGYRRLDLDRLSGPHHGDEATPHPEGGVRWAIIPLSALLCIIQAVATILASNIREMFLTSTLIAVVAYGVLVGAVLLVNPVLRLARHLLGHWARPLSRIELICVFSAMTVTAGISTFGLTEQLIPTVAAPNNPEWNTAQSGWSDLVSHMNGRLYLQDPATIRAFRQGITTLPDGTTRLIWPRNPSPFSAATWGYFWDVTRQVPWGQWVVPLAYWMVFVGASYGIFYCLTYIVLGYWADREKLIFPLARLPESMLPGKGRGLGRVPPMLKTTMFWVGFAISFGAWSWNAAVSTGSVSGLSRIPLGMGAMQVRAALTDTIFMGLTSLTNNDSLMFLIIFTAVGIAFLLPLEVSFSIWFYYIVGRLITLGYIWSGRGLNVDDFPTDFILHNNMVNAAGAGGVFAFAAICLFRCIRDYVRLVRGKSVVQRLVIGLPVVGLVVCMGIVSGWLVWNRLPVLWAILFVFCLTLLTLGIMRIVAEAGIYVFQAHAGFFHFYDVFAIGKVLAPVFVAPILPIYSVLFMDIKTFMAPNLLNVAEMERRAPGNRWWFHLNLVLSIVISVVASLFTAILLAHVRGAQAMESWFYSLGPPWIINNARTALATPPAFETGNAIWYAIGAAWVVLSVWLRATFFWFPHPVGFIMLINPLASMFWFSFFVGWVCKKAVVVYGGKSTFDRVRGFFIGLIFGELAAILFWSILSLVMDLKSSGVTLNRYGM